MGAARARGGVEGAATALAAFAALRAFFALDAAFVFAVFFFLAFFAAGGAGFQHAAERRLDGVANGRGHGRDRAARLVHEAGHRRLHAVDDVLAVRRRRSSWQPSIRRSRGRRRGPARP